MDHTMVVRQKMTERYLLAELEPEVRDEFEEHYFDCAECALDVSAGAQFVSQSKAVLAENAEPIAMPAPRPRPNQGWFAWLRPMFAAPVLALLLAVVGYQNLVTLPGLRSDASEARVLPSASVNLDTYGVGGPATVVPAGKGLLLFLRIPQDWPALRYTGELRGPSGKLESSFAIQATPGQDQWPVEVPNVVRETGDYTVTVQGISASGEKKDLGSKTFPLQIQH
jgi:Putative zinc-finger